MQEGLGCRSNATHAFVISWIIGARRMENLFPGCEPALKCCVCCHANRIMCLGLCVRQIRKKVQIFPCKHFNFFHYMPFRFLSSCFNGQ
ncbi:hypothetical protein PR202_ga12762 [Eleusine coracana subsp. coracana]|uniref:Uncharacterized protein n=1 Tax=Eleusine coracana subsp. coracana TaxID=191504 RepID=A0AAV5CCI2_ELECO|nr:hypothetical protein PR202_ga12762 [Eleusine coracana subsp. coracana]